jgi:hypothetical protein
MLIHSKFRRRLTWLAVAATVAACLLIAYLLLRPSPSSVRGILLNVEASSLIYTERIVVRDDTGRQWTFRVSPDGARHPTDPQSASHLRQHMILAEPMRVYYRATGEGPLAVHIVDGPEAPGR